MISVADEAHMDPDAPFQSVPNRTGLRGNVPKNKPRFYALWNHFKEAKEPIQHQMREAPLDAKRPSDTWGVKAKDIRRSRRKYTDTHLEAHTQPQRQMESNTHEHRRCEQPVDPPTSPLGGKRGLRAAMTVFRSWLLAGGEAAAADAKQAGLDMQRWRINQA